MERKRNALCFGAFLVIFVVYLTIAKPFDTNMSNLSYLATGAVLLLLYYSKRNTIALILGVLLFEMSFYTMLPSIIKITAVQVLFFFVPGTIFLSLFLTKGKQGMLIPGSFLSWLGLGMVLSNSITAFQAKPLMVLCFGCAFVTVYLLGNLNFVQTYLYIGLIICGLGLILFFRSITLEQLPMVGWVVVAILLFVLFVQSRRKNNGRKR